MKKIKVFLGGYLNYTNAQNLNCRALAKYLDKDKFEVSAMLFPGGNISIDKDLSHVKFFKLRRPVRFWRYLTYLRGILSCDVAYLPKGEIWRYCYNVAKLFGKKTFITVEGVIDKETYEGMKSLCKNDDGIRNLYHGCNRTYSITRFMKDKNESLLGIKSNGILYLGVENDNFQYKTNKEKEINDSLELIFIGNDVKRKRVGEFLELARIYPNCHFNICGGGEEWLLQEIDKKQLKNITYHGRLTHEELSRLLSTMDLHVFPSRSEGFPKVTLETAAAGVPSIVYSDYGASEWITSGKNGFVVDNFEEIVKIISDLKQNPENLQSLRKEAVAMARRFDWKVLIKNWEQAIMQLVSDEN